MMTSEALDVYDNGFLIANVELIVKEERLMVVSILAFAVGLILNELADLVI